jgi:ribA/ribD-fused uncharacterized protein
MWSRETLASHASKGGAIDYLFFWGHTPADPRKVDASCLSQWFPRPFTREGVTYATAEHFMMAEKARLFGDARALDGILASPSPSEVKALGRKVTPYDDRAWAAARVDAVVQGNVAKFEQHEDLAQFLLATGDRVLVEASPRDCIWGIGLGASNPAARTPGRWRGLNLLGFALVEVRQRLLSKRGGPR